MLCLYGHVEGRTDQVPCERQAEPGWTTCKRHHSAGTNRKHWLARRPKR